VDWQSDPKWKRRVQYPQATCRPTGSRMVHGQPHEFSPLFFLRQFSAQKLADKALIAHHVDRSQTANQPGQLRAEIMKRRTLRDEVPLVIISAFAPTSEPLVGSSNITTARLGVEKPFANHHL